ncbi:hypothetical protein PR048_023036 [Dryococelus australis]|uniref:Uncharacterized protein n=1 Tax=Dryococelus australis TaxID=614101 RepID=A0ABQ9GSZ0_9NEOP|nr:hypothetical protein PR048_023036 [Dryococelus australis]
MVGTASHISGKNITLNCSVPREQYDITPPVCGEGTPALRSGCMRVSELPHLLPALGPHQMQRTATRFENNCLMTPSLKIAAMGCQGTQDEVSSLGVASSSYSPLVTSAKLRVGWNPRPRSRSEVVIRETLIRASSVSSLLSAKIMQGFRRDAVLFILKEALALLLSRQEADTHTHILEQEKVVWRVKEERWKKKSGTHARAGTTERPALVVAATSAWSAAHSRWSSRPGKELFWQQRAAILPSASSISLTLSGACVARGGFGETEIMGRSPDPPPIRMCGKKSKINLWTLCCITVAVLAISALPVTSSSSELVRAIIDELLDKRIYLNFRALGGPWLQTLVSVHIAEPGGWDDQNNFRLALNTSFISITELCSHPYRKYSDDNFTPAIGAAESKLAWTGDKTVRSQRRRPATEDKLQACTHLLIWFESAFAPELISSRASASTTASYGVSYISAQEKNIKCSPEVQSTATYNAPPDGINELGKVGSMSMRISARNFLTRAISAGAVRKSDKDVTAGNFTRQRRRRVIRRSLMNYRQIRDWTQYPRRDSTFLNMSRQPCGLVYKPLCDQVVVSCSDHFGHSHRSPVAHGPEFASHWKDCEITCAIHQNLAAMEVGHYCLLFLVILATRTWIPIRVRGCSGAAGRVLASHQGNPGLNPSGATPGFSRVRIALDYAAVWRVFSGISRSPPPPTGSGWHCRFTLIDCQGTPPPPDVNAGLPIKPAFANFKWGINVKRNSFSCVNFKLSEEIWAALNSEVLRADEGDRGMERRRNKRRGKREISEKTRRPAASPGTILTRGNLRSDPSLEADTGMDLITVQVPASLGYLLLLSHYVAVDGTLSRLGSSANVGPLLPGKETIGRRWYGRWEGVLADLSARLTATYDRTSRVAIAGVMLHPHPPPSRYHDHQACMPQECVSRGTETHSGIGYRRFSLDFSDENTPFKKTRNPMRVIEVNMERRRNEGAGETGDPRENPPTNGIVRHDSHLRKSEIQNGRRLNHAAQVVHFDSRYLPVAPPYAYTDFAAEILCLLLHREVLYYYSPHHYLLQAICSSGVSGLSLPGSLDSAYNEIRMEQRWNEDGTRKMYHMEEAPPTPPSPSVAFRLRRDSLIHYRALHAQINSRENLSQGATVAPSRREEEACLFHVPPPPPPLTRGDEEKPVESGYRFRLRRLVACKTALAGGHFCRQVTLDDTEHAHWKPYRSITGGSRTDCCTASNDAREIGRSRIHGAHIPLDIIPDVYRSPAGCCRRMIHQQVWWRHLSYATVGVPGGNDIGTGVPHTYMAPMIWPRLKAVHDKVNTCEINLRIKLLPLPALILTGRMSDMRLVKLVTREEKVVLHITVQPKVLVNSLYTCFNVRRHPSDAWLGAILLDWGDHDTISPTRQVSPIQTAHDCNLFVITSSFSEALLKFCFLAARFCILSLHVEK